MRHKNKRILSKSCQLVTFKGNIISLSSFDDKLYIFDDGNKSISSGYKNKWIKSNYYQKWKENPQNHYHSENGKVKAKEYCRIDKERL